MSIQTLYVCGKSKKEINARLAAGETVTGDNYSAFGGAGTYKLDATLPEGTVIKIYTVFAQGSPYAKAYGNWKRGRIA